MRETLPQLSVANTINKSTKNLAVVQEVYDAPRDSTTLGSASCISFSIAL